MQSILDDVYLCDEWPFLYNYHNYNGNKNFSCVTELTEITKSSPSDI